MCRHLQRKERVCLGGGGVGFFWVSAPVRQQARSRSPATGNVRVAVAAAAVAGANERSDGRPIAADDDDRRARERRFFPEKIGKILRQFLR